MKLNKAAAKRAFIKGSKWEVKNNILGQTYNRTVDIVQANQIGFIKDDGLHSWLDFSLIGFSYYVNEEGTRIEAKDANGFEKLIYTKEN